MEPLKQNHQRIFSVKKAKKCLISLVLVLIFELVLFPAPSFAQETGEENIDMADIGQEIRIDGKDSLFDLSQDEINIGMLIAGQIEPEFINSLPQNSLIRARKTGIHTITAYNSEVGQTDDTPCITANGFNVCEHGLEDTIAANFLPFGAKIKIPQIFGDRVFIVRDRMNQRYYDRIDIWMLNKTEAIKFGLKIAKIEILE